jgi:hypothetical protein
MPTDDSNIIKPDMTPDQFGRVPMVCESGLSMTKACMARLMMHVLKNDIELLSIRAFDSNYHGSQVLAAFRIKPEQIADFEAETGGLLRPPATIKLN